jgi:tRNA (cytidine/uridine-2'-O-)-methyltransferase
VTIHRDLDAARAMLAGRWFAFSAGANGRYTDVRYEDDDVVVFGTERTGLRPEVLADERIAQVLTIPMAPHSRSLNLANAVSVVVYEAWRQRGFPGAAERSGAVALTVEALGSAHVEE